MGKVIGILLFVAAIWFGVESFSSGQFGGSSKVSATEPSLEGDHPKGVIQRAQSSVQHSMDEMESRYRDQEKKLGSH